MQPYAIRPAWIALFFVFILWACALDFKHGSKAPTSDTTVEPTYGDKLVPVFFAAGKLKRTLFSCDGGRSWVGDHSVDDSARCFQNGFDCDHHEFSNTGMAITNKGTVVVGLGHGAGGDIIRSNNGIDWSVVASNKQLLDIVLLNGQFFGGNKPLINSLDDGKNWSSAPALSPDPPLQVVRKMTVIPGSPQRIFMAGEDGASQGGRYSDDAGLTWTSSSMDGCVNGAITPGKNGVVLMFGATSKTCRSGDRGATWTEVPAPGQSYLTMADGTFLALGYGSIQKSDDGLNWTAVPSTNASPFLAAYHPATKTYVGIQQSFGNWYEKQKFWYSTDALNWINVPDAKGGHPIGQLAAGYLYNSKLCPGSP